MHEKDWFAPKSLTLVSWIVHNGIWTVLRASALSVLQPHSNPGLTGFGMR